MGAWEERWAETKKTWTRPHWEGVALTEAQLCIVPMVAQSGHAPALVLQATCATI